MSLQNKTIVLPILGESKILLTLQEESLEILTSHKGEIEFLVSSDIDEVNMHITSEFRRIYASLEEDIEVIEYLPELPEEINISLEDLEGVLTPEELIALKAENREQEIQDSLDFESSIINDIINESFTIKSFDEL